MGAPHPASIQKPDVHTEVAQQHHWQGRVEGADRSAHEAHSMYFPTSAPKRAGAGGEVAGFECAVNEVNTFTFFVYVVNVYCVFHKLIAVEVDGFSRQCVVKQYTDPLVQ